MKLLSAGKRSMFVLTLAASMVFGLLVITPPVVAGGPPVYPGEPLTIGSSGPDVVLWQSALGISSDGSFGPATRSATVAWQQENGMVGHGWVGEAAWARMFGQVAIPELVLIEGSGWGHGVGMSQYGAKGMAEAGFGYEDILSYFYSGSTVAQAVEVLGSEHWVLNTAHPIWVNVLQNTDGVTVAATEGSLTFCQAAPDDMGTLELGSEGLMVEVLQHKLIALGHLVGAADGDFGPMTAGAVESFQTSEGITIDGRVGTETLEALWPPDEAGEQCVIEVVFSGSSSQVFSRTGEVCTFSLAPAGMSSPVEASCDASIRGEAQAELTPDNHVRLPKLRNREYSGGFLRLRKGSGTTDNVHAIHQVDIETYVAGIDEVPGAWPEEALQAQAVAARSYGLYPLRSGSDSLKTVCSCHHYSSTSSQVYVGYTRVLDAGWKAAVDATAGEVMEHASYGLVQTFFSSSAGGRTQNSEDVFVTPRDYLVSVQDLWSTDPASGNPNWRWDYSFSPTAISSALGVGELVSIQVTDRYVSGATKTVTVKYLSGEEVVSGTFPGKSITSKLGLKGRYYDIAWPSPEGSNGFIDTYGSVHRQDIETLAELGITFGCNPPSNTMFCPDKEVTRGQMAAFLVRAFDLPETSADFFADDNGTTFEADINRLAAAGVTSGCGGGNYCPDETLPRGQMAAFITRALDLPVFDGDDRFIDDNDSPFEDEIERLAEAGITLGCNPPSNDRFCPSSLVTRAQMASFIIRAVSVIESNR